MFKDEFKKLDESIVTFENKLSYKYKKEILWTKS